MEKIECCPFCKSENIEMMAETNEKYYWHCHDCDCDFNKDDYLHQLYWENISCLLNGTSIEKPFVFENEYVILSSVDEESCGLSELEKPSIDKVHQIDGDGKMYYHFEDTPDEDEYWYDMYELSTEDLKTLLDSIREENSPF